MNQDTTAQGWARRTIKTAGLRLTNSRVATLLVLRDSSTPLTHAEVSTLLKENEIDPATIFRNLNDMATANLLRRSELGDHVWRFELITEEEHKHESHPHFVCVDCGRVSCLKDMELAGINMLESKQILHVTEIVLRGQCHDCT